MKSDSGRRNFLRMLGIGGATAAMAAMGEETHGEEPARTSREQRSFKGTSKKGDYQEALQNAINAAQRSVRHPDAMVEWAFRSASGRSGGFAGFREVTVTIDAKVS
jgi:hypothetical protein